jgi:F-type H+-transporting ATPase subunit c
MEGETNVKLKLFWSGLAALVLAAPGFGAEQPAAAASPNVHWILLAAAFAMAIASGLCGLAQGKAVAAACEGMGRNPGAASAIRGIALLGLVLIESLALYTLVVCFILLFAKS